MSRTLAPVPRLAIRNLGPIDSGVIELRPLTVLIGPNNSGKSYAAQLTYALAKALSGRTGRPIGTQLGVDDFLDRQLREEQERIPFRQLPVDRQAVLNSQLDRYTSELTSDLDESLRRSFGAEDSRDLIRGGMAGEQRMTVDIDRVGGQERFLEIAIDADGFSWGQSLTDILETSVPMSADPAQSPMSDAPYTLGLIARHLWSQILAANGFPSGNTYYLPAARSGIITGLEAYTTAAIDRVWRGAGTAPIAIASFPGVAADFLQAMVSLLLSPEPSVPQELMEGAIELLEGRVLKGQVSAKGDGMHRMAMLYDSDGLRMPVHRTSAMVAELAPLSLWLKYLIRPGDVLIVDEPEAHLHLENQRLIARVLVRLVRAGVRVICPTHSSVILHQLSNHLLAAGLDQQAAEEMGFPHQDVLHADELGVYLFRPSVHGTLIEPVEVEPDWGISEDEFVRVFETIGEETFRLSTVPRPALVSVP